MEEDDKIKTYDDMIEFFDENYDMIHSMGEKPKDFTPLIDALEILLKQMKITRDVSIEVQNELGECSEEEFTVEASKRLQPRLKELEEQREQFDDTLFKTLLFKLPNKKGKTFFQLMKRMEEAGAIPKEDKSRRSKIDSVIDDLEKYIEEIKEFNKPFIPAAIDENQTIIFKVMFKNRKGTWRKIEMKASQTLDDLHRAIQNAIGWDNDHLYSFFMNNNFNSTEPDTEFTSPFEPEGRKTADIEVGAFAFKKSQKFAYLFDFGDDHRFEIQVIDFGKVENGKQYPALLESKRKAPEQYPDLEDL